MGRKFFGTDGIRGRTNAGVMTAATAMKVGQAAGTYFQRGDHRHRVVIGKDTRLSGYMLENAMTAGFTSVGMDVVLLGPLPTPAVAMLTREMRADVGVMISASHNPYEDNGIKLFGPDGFKLSDEAELAIDLDLHVEGQQAALALQHDVRVGAQREPDLVLAADRAQRARDMPAHTARQVRVRARRGRVSADFRAIRRALALGEPGQLGDRPVAGELPGVGGK